MEILGALALFFLGLAVGAGACWHYALARRPVDEQLLRAELRALRVAYRLLVDPGESHGAPQSSTGHR